MDWEFPISSPIGGIRTSSPTHDLLPWGCHFVRVERDLLQEFIISVYWPVNSGFGDGCKASSMFKLVVAIDLSTWIFLEVLTLWSRSTWVLTLRPAIRDLITDMFDSICWFLGFLSCCQWSTIAPLGSCGISWAPLGWLLWSVQSILAGPTGLLAPWIAAVATLGMSKFPWRLLCFCNNVPGLVSWLLGYRFWQMPKPFSGCLTIISVGTGPGPGDLGHRRIHM